MADSSFVWSKEQYDGDTATRVWFVHGTADQAEAEVAPPLSGSPPIAQRGESHPRKSSLKCTRISGDHFAPYSFFINCTYGVPSTGTVENPDDPTSLPPETQVDWDVETEEMDADVDGIPIINAAGDPFDTGLPRERWDLNVTVVRNEHSYPINKSLAYAGMVNQGNFTIPNLGTVSEGQALCMPIRSPAGFTQQSSYIPVVYTFKIRSDGWRSRVKNKGLGGWSRSGNTFTPGKFCNANGEEMASPVLLDKGGVPIDTEIKVKTADGTVTDASTYHRLAVPPEYYEELAKGFAIRFKKYKMVSFAGMFT